MSGATRAMAAALVLAALTAATAAAAELTLAPAGAVGGGALPRLGLNLGGASTWGAEQLMNNIVKNPGFEAGIERTLVVVARIDGDTVEDDTAWLARPAGFWQAARYDVRTGRAAGAGGRIVAAGRAGGAGAARLTLFPVPAGLAPGDTLVVSADAPPAQPPLWWVGSGMVGAQAGQRPGGAGRQVARLNALPGVPAALFHHFDTIGARAGKLLPLHGRWRLGLWARAAGAPARLEIAFGRQGAAPLLRRSVELGAAWRYVDLPFDASDDGPAATISLELRCDDGEILLDDVTLGEAAAGAGGFRRDVVDMLAALRPGYLRDWQGQLGDSLENRIAAPFARRPSRYRPGQDEQLYFYGLDQFFALCAAVGARPWVVAPALLDDAEWRAFGSYLRAAAARHGFDEMLVEFGNENWNPLFRAGGFTDSARHAAAAQRGFALLQAGAAPYRGIVTVANAQYVNPASWPRLALAAPAAARIAVAPYFLHTLDRGAAAVPLSFADTGEHLLNGAAAVSALGRRVAVAEVNFHTTGGNAGASERALAVGGAHSGPALARRFLQASLAGVREQAAYALAGYDSRADNGALVPLWGLARDLAPGTLRPTGRALALLNEVYGGQPYASACRGDGPDCAALTALWLRDGADTSLAVVSAAPAPLLVHTTLPCSASLQLALLDGSNAPGEPVRSRPPCHGHWSFNLPPYSLAVARWSAATGSKR